jgi:succinyl-diaminopimelate desuccinylase
MHLRKKMVKEDKMQVEFIEDSYLDLLIRITQELIRIPTQNPPGNEKECAEFVNKTLIEWGVKTEMVFEPYLHRPQVVAMVNGNKSGRTLILNGHMDVVPEGSRDRWEDDPYGGTIKEGKIFGRGSSDMKGGLAVMMILAKLLHEKGFPRGRVLFQFVVGEETGEPGTKDLLIKRGIRGDYGIVLEPTSLRVATAEKGLIWFRVTLAGRPAHASIAEQGINPIEKILKLGGRLVEYDMKLRMYTHPFLGSRKCSMTMINAGTKENVIPESCSLVLDRRFNPEETSEGVEREIRGILDQLASEDQDFKYQLERMVVFEPAEIPIDSFLPTVLRKYTSQISGVPTEPFGMLASTDVRNFINDAGIPAVNFGPGDLQDPHTFNEKIEIRQLVDCIKILFFAMSELLG